MRPPASTAVLPPAIASLAQVTPPVSPDPSVSFVLPAPMYRGHAVPHTTYDFEGMGSREGPPAAGLVASVPRSFLSFLGGDGGDPNPSVKGQGR